MSIEARAIELLFSWFRDNPFKVRDINEDMAEELAVLIGFDGSSCHDRRTRIGIYLHSLDGREISRPSAIYVLTVQKHATDSSPGQFQIKQSSKAGLG